MALLAPLVWEVRPATGSANNGGGFDSTSGTPGTDRSQQAAAHVKWVASGGSSATSTFTNDLASTSASSWLVITSAARATALGNSGGFAAADVGNILNITAGTNFTAGRYQIISVDGSGNATLDRACGATGNATAGSGYLGGAVASIASVGAIAVSGNVIHQNPGATDTLSGSLTLANGVFWYGYSVTRGDLSAQSWSASHTSAGPLTATGYPLVDVQANTLTTGTLSRVECIRVTHARTGTGFVTGSSCTLWRCQLAATVASTVAMAVSVGTNGVLIDCDLSATSAAGGFVASTGNRGVAFSVCRITSTSGGGIQTSAGLTGTTVDRCVFYKMAASQTAIQAAAADVSLAVLGCTFDSILGTCITLPNSAQATGALLAINNQVTNCGTFANNLRSGTTRLPITAFNNRIRNTTTTYTGWANIADNGSAPFDITTAETDADEYVSQSASPPDLHLNSNAAGKGVGLPPYLDTGAWQRQESSGGISRARLVNAA